MMNPHIVLLLHTIRDTIELQYMRTSTEYRNASDIALHNHLNCLNPFKIVVVFTGQGLGHFFKDVYWKRKN